MIRKNLLRGIPFAVALGLIMAPTIPAHAEAYGTGLTKSIGEDLDLGFMIKPEVFVNMQEMNADSIKVTSNGAYLPLEKVASQMGDILEGSYEYSYLLRKADKLININVKDNTYAVNGIKSNIEFEIIDNEAYAPVNFFKEVLGYNMKFEGNSIYIGQASDSVNVDLSGDFLIDDAMMVNPEIFINSERYPDFGVQVHDGKVYLPLETVTAKMGDRLEGDFTTEYYLRKDNMMLVIDFSSNKYILNGVEHNEQMFNLGGRVYASLDFYKDVLKYTVTENGNIFNIGEVKEKEVFADTVADGKWSLENGVWYYYNDGNKVTGWVRYKNNWYYLKDDGAMATGWILLDGKWYLLNNDGAMETGWIIDNDGNAYYLNKDGSMAAGTVVDGFTLAHNGIAISMY
ncbi:MAG: stalk domain-containing protein [Clostridium sp.]